MSVARGHYILKAAWVYPWSIANPGTTKYIMVYVNDALIACLRLHHGERIVLRGVIVGLVGVMPKYPPFLKP